MAPAAVALTYEKLESLPGDVPRVEEIESGPAQKAARCANKFGSTPDMAITIPADIDALPTMTKTIRVTLTRDEQPRCFTAEEATGLNLQDGLHDSSTGACACKSYHVSTSTATATSIYTSTTTSTVFITSLRYLAQRTPHTPKSLLPSASPPTFFHPHHPMPRQLSNLPPKLSAYNENGALESLTPLSIAILVLALLVMAAGFAWVVVVYWVNFPPTWPIGRETNKDATHFRRKRRRGWRAWFEGGRLFRRAGKPSDKPSRYARLGSSDEYDSDEEVDGGRDHGIGEGEFVRAAGTATGKAMESAMSTATLFMQPPFPNGSAIELRERKGKKAQHVRNSSERLRHVASPEADTTDASSSSSSSTPNGHRGGDSDGKGQTAAAHRRTINLPSFQPPPTNSTAQQPLSPSSTVVASPSSPHNPLLPSPPRNPSLHHRNSATWLRDREAFFSALQTPSNPVPIPIPIPNPNPLHRARPSSSPNKSTHSPSPRCSFDSISDLESQSQYSQQADSRESSTHLRGGYVALLNGRRGNGNGNGNSNGNRKGKRRVDGSGSGTVNGNGNGNGNARAWLEAVDGAVNRVVDRMVRWTDDRDGEEGLLLPVAE